MLGRLYSVGCLSVRTQAVSLCVSRARHLSACLFHVSARGAIIAAATANSRLLSQQNPYKTCVSLVELGRTSRHFIVHFQKKTIKKFPRYRRCAHTAPNNTLKNGVSTKCAWEYARETFLLCIFASLPITIRGEHGFGLVARDKKSFIVRKVAPPG